jgi:hypothetical protein
MVFTGTAWQNLHSGPIAMWRRLGIWLRFLFSRKSRDGVAGSERSRLVGLYLSQHNRDGRMRGRHFTPQERADGKFAQKRARD